MDDFIEAFAIYLREERGLQVATVDRYERGAAELVSFLAQHYPQLGDPQQVEKDHVVAFLRSASTQRAASWNINLAALKAFFVFLEVVGAIAVSPAIGIARMQSLPRDVVPLSFDEFTRLLDAVDEAPGEFYRRRNRLILLVLFFGGVRVSELVSWSGSTSIRSTSTSASSSAYAASAVVALAHRSMTSSPRPSSSISSCASCKMSPSVSKPCSSPIGASESACARCRTW